MDKENLGIFQMLIAATLWSIAGIFLKFIPWNAFVIAGLRSGLAATTMIIYMLITKQKIKFNKRILINASFTCAVFMMFITANKLTTAANAIVLQFTSPIWLMIASAFIFQKKFKLHDIFAGIATMLGVGLCFLDQMEGGHMIGNIVAIGAGAMMACMMLCIGTGTMSDRMNGALFGQLFTAVIGIPFIFFTDFTLTKPAVLSILVLGIFQLGISYILYVQSTKTCPPLACSILGAAEPLLNPIWVAIFDGEKPGILALIGGLIVIIAVTLWCILDSKKNKVLLQKNMM